ncbi:sensor histidine kinase [Solilutibacter silvestris]|uniref:histidine kinase n=1 Tax=Solilutibacter silvestris TaxID=1645665 RepID=A0A2K1Q208_9GAMM|nr:sensor histidine kinase [Lysobacter silvestris]PNS09088.1 Histidine kinase-, DNA gyrase B-, and HSP90-like ATPase [Lysobacter silvestris]
MSEHERAPRRRSLYRSLLLYLSVPLTVLAILAALVTYEMARYYSNRAHDSALIEQVDAVAKLMDHSPETFSTFSPQALFLIQYDPDGFQYYAITSAHRGVIAANFQPPAASLPVQVGAPVKLSSIRTEHHLRLASRTFHPKVDSTDTVTVTVGEGYSDRRRWAQQILLITVPTLLLMVVGVLLVVRSGVDTGLRQLDPLIARLRRGDALSKPLLDANVPSEVAPLAGTIDNLVSDLREALAVQSRFIADAAHQLRTPLAGLSLHAERALDDPRPEVLEDALGHVSRLTHRTSRIAEQLLSLARAQSVQTRLPERVDLAEVVPLLVGERVPDALRAGIDLGYEAPSQQSLHAAIDVPALQEALDNLIDNALHHAGRGHNTTVSLSQRDGAIELAVEDDGTGVPDETLARLGERFFQVAGSNARGSGLGLAIVEEVLSRYGGQVRYVRGASGGLRVELLLPIADAPGKADETAG